MPSACAPPLPMKLPVNCRHELRECEARYTKTDQSLSETPRTVESTLRNRLGETEERMGGRICCYDVQYLLSRITIMQ